MVQSHRHYKIQGVKLSCADQNILFPKYYLILANYTCVALLLHFLLLFFFLSLFITILECLSLGCVVVQLIPGEEVFPDKLYGKIIFCGCHFKPMDP